MYLAEATSATSLSTSRRVGAALVSRDGRSVVAVGKNEVPEGAVADTLLGFDYSDREKKSVGAAVLAQLAEAGWLREDKAELVKSDPDAFEAEVQLVLVPTPIGQIIEFQRAVHAEMWAILDAARRGVPLAGTTMYCNTYPCHLCWKHIASAGIERTYYIEPYPKSRASSMYESTVETLQPFVGIAPRAFMDLFANRDLPAIEPSSGRIKTPDREKAVPIAEKLSSPEGIPERETDFLSPFSQWIV